MLINYPESQLKYAYFVLRCQQILHNGVIDILIVNFIFLNSPNISLSLAARHQLHPLPIPAAPNAEHEDLEACAYYEAHFHRVLILAAIPMLDQYM